LKPLPAGIEYLVMTRCLSRVGFIRAAKRYILSNKMNVGVNRMTLPVRLEYFALLREQRGLDAETVLTECGTARELYREIAASHGFTLPEERVRVAVNNAFVPWDRTLAANDTVVFIPPVAGG
jgi:molybdopterin synthase sulfur carrier subunit